MPSLNIEVSAPPAGLNLPDVEPAAAKAPTVLEPQEERVEDFDESRYEELARDVFRIRGFVDAQLRDSKTKKPLATSGNCDTVIVLPQPGDERRCREPSVADKAYGPDGSSTAVLYWLVTWEGFTASADTWESSLSLLKSMSSDSYEELVREYIDSRDAVVDSLIALHLEGHATDVVGFEDLDQAGPPTATETLVHMAHVARQTMPISCVTQIGRSIRPPTRD